MTKFKREEEIWMAYLNKKEGKDAKDYQILSFLSQNMTAAMIREYYPDMVASLNKEIRESV